MSWSNPRDYEGCIVLGLLGCFLFGAFAGGCSVKMAYERSAVQQGKAEYDKETGIWRWKP